MKIIICHASLNQKGGGERAVLEIAKRFDATIYTTHYNKSYTYPEFLELDVRPLPRLLLELPFSVAARLDPDSRMVDVVESAFRFSFLKIKEDYDVLNPHSFPSEYVAFRNERVCWYCHSPSRGAYDLHSTFLSQRNILGKSTLKIASAVNKLLDRYSINRIGTICANSEITAKRINDYLGRYDVDVIHPAVDHSSFYCAGFSRFFFYPSRFIPEKRQEYAIEAFRLSKLRGWSLILAGFLPDNKRCKAYFEYLKKKAKGLDVKFVLHPTDQKMRELYASCYATLFCGMDEDWGLIPLESMAACKPVVSVNEGGPTISILHAKTGFLVNSPSEMAERMRFLAERPDVCEKMGKEGRKHVMRNYTWKRFLEKLEKVFRKTAKL
ncbi:MAG: glycosyltransferase family 4 protein [Candidatus Micrarchaeota archaeon]|nr:glycosyltransferase family 4 protein [Candidatus Micrarchaeota archaeon]